MIIIMIISILNENKIMVMKEIMKIININIYNIKQYSNNNNIK